MENIEKQSEFFNSFIISTEDLKKVSECHERVLLLIHHSDLHEDLIEYLLSPFEKLLQHSGINLHETNY